MSFLVLESRKIPFNQLQEAATAKHWSDYSLKVLRFCADWLKGNSEFEISTSGSTGDPQKIIWSRNLMQWSIQNTAKALNLRKNWHCLHCIDITKAGGMMMMARILELEMSAEIVPPSSNPWTQASTPPYDFAAMVPLQVHELIMQHAGEAFNHIRLLIIGGAHLSPLLITSLQTVNTKVYATYGMTETASHIALQRINGSEKQSAFRPLQDVTITTDENDCAIIQTPFHKGLATNDIIELHDDGSFNIIGRIDNRINTGGYKVQIEKIEEATEKVLTDLKINFFNFCAYWKADEKLGEKIILIFEVSEKEIDGALVLKELGSYLEKYEIPKQIFFTNKLCYTDSGKVNRKLSADLIE